MTPASWPRTRPFRGWLLALSLAAVLCTSACSDIGEPCGFACDPGSTLACVTSECASGYCAIGVDGGHCTDHCTNDGDCPNSFDCVGDVTTRWCIKIER